ncbi:nicotinate-nucleotide pyrophosphorylase [Nitzschia inconspicua]|uniref:Nicotinate-nucleotide pyrophosphorylase [carboxylating] n=1 Tax=Nitzschia inconspicua TaxID=303405 RepID=A0A9K3LVX1_9STRA|nr:nicotinate-nucleotide pyrophosphorylase [Nitzschia inconspicua]
MSESDFSALLPQDLDQILHGWLRDDMPSFDVGGLVVGKDKKEAHLLMKSSGVFAGKPFFQRVLELVGCTVEWDNAVAKEGSYIEVESGNKICLATVTGPVYKLLRAERTALNTLSRCSGVATLSREAAERAKSLGWNGYVAGTRKTTPGFRVVEKYGLLVGGAATHRLDLSQMVMLKDNHIWACGSITKAVELARTAAGFSQKIEVECQNLDEALEAAAAGADIVMLDNFGPQQLRKDAAIFKEKYPQVLVEASGGITTETMPQYLCDHVDVISQGKLTQGYSCVDFSLKIKQ